MKEDYKKRDKTLPTKENNKFTLSRSLIYSKEEASLQNHFKYNGTDKKIKYN